MQHVPWLLQPRLLRHHKTTGRFMADFRRHELGKFLANSHARPADVPSSMVNPTVLTDIFIDFDGTLTVSSGRALEYVLPLLEPCRGLRVSDAVDRRTLEEAVLIWQELDVAMAGKVEGACVDMSDASVLGTSATRRALEEECRLLVDRGLRLHLLTMGTPQAQRALMEAAGFDVGLFTDWLGPFDMARCQGLRNLFDNGDKDGAEAASHFEFSVDEDIAALEAVRDRGERTRLLERIMTVENRLSKASLVRDRTGQGGLLLDDNWSRNVCDAREKGVMHVHVDPEGIVQTVDALRHVRELLETDTSV